MIVQLYKYIKRLFSYKTEERYVAAALRRYQDELYNLNCDFDPIKDCCQDCMTGGGYTKLIEKIERVEKQLNRLKNKREKNVKKKRN